MTSLEIISLIGNRLAKSERIAPHGIGEYRRVDSWNWSDESSREVFVKDTEGKIWRVSVNRYA